MTEETIGCQVSELDQYSDIYNIIPKTLSFLQYEKQQL